MSDGELRLTADSFEKLKNSVNDLANRAKTAKDSLESLFLIGYGRSYSEDIGKVANHFAKLEELIDGVNNKLSITSAFMRDIFSGQASDIREVAKALSMMNRAASGGGSRRGGGGGIGGGMLGGDSEESDRGWKANWVSSLDAVVSVGKLRDKLAKQSEKDRAKQAKLDNTQAELLRKATSAYYKEQVAAEEQVAKLKVAEQERILKLKAKEQDEENKAWWKRLSNLRAEEKAVEQAYLKRRQMAEKAKAVELKNRTPFFEDKFNKLVEMGRRRFYMSQVMGNNFGRAAGTFGGSGQGMLSRFGPGLLGILGRYRVFQKPFPGSERNVFALGDLAAAGQNVVSGAGGSVQRSFDTLTSSAFAVNRAFGGIVAATASLIPGIGPAVGAAIGVLTDVVVGMLEKLSQAISGVIGGLTRLATALAGFATRAVEAAANFTEAVNAARVVAGPEAAASMQREALVLQREFGISATDLMRGMGRIAGQLRQVGNFDPKEAGDLAKIMARQMADIASVNNTAFENVVRDNLSGIVGRFTPNRKNMLSFTAPELDAMAKAQGLKNPMLRTDLAARVTVYLQEYTRQAGLFAGDLERTRYEFANQRRKFLGGFEAMFMTVGRILEPFAKAVLIVSNDLIDSVFSMIAPFAEDPYTAFKQSIESFAYYVIYAKNIIVELAQSLYDSRGVILEYAQYIGKQFLQLTLMLVRYSANVLSLFAGLLQGLAGLIPAIELFGNALVYLSNAIYRMIPTTDTATIEKRNRIEQMTKEMAAIQGGKSEYSRPGMANQRQKRLDFLRNQIAATAMDLNKPSPVQELLLGTGNILENTAKSLDSFQRQFADAVKSLVGDTGVNTDEMKALLGKLAPAISAANEIAPKPALTMAGNLVRYFSPEAFRDNIQEREVQNAQMRTADATEGILKAILENNGGFGQGNAVSTPSRAALLNSMRLENMVTVP